LSGFRRNTVRIISRARRRKARKSRYVLELPVTLLIMIVPVVYWQRNFFVCI
jgi:hypothetical protein